MSKRYEVENFGEELKDIESALKAIHGEMHNISEERGFDSNSLEYIAKGEQLSVRVYKQHF